MYDGEEVTIYPKQDELTPSIYPILLITGMTKQQYIRDHNYGW